MESICLLHVLHHNSSVSTFLLLYACDDDLIYYGAASWKNQLFHLLMPNLTLEAVLH